MNVSTNRYQQIIKNRLSFSKCQSYVFADSTSPCFRPTQKQTSLLIIVNFHFATNKTSVYSKEFLEKIATKTMPMTKNFHLVCQHKNREFGFWKKRYLSSKENRLKNK